MNYELMIIQNVLVKMWIKGVLVEDDVCQQLINMVKMLFIFKYIVVMLDVYLGKGLIIGSVILMKGVIILVVVGVDIGCGMNVLCISLMVVDLLENLVELCSVIEVVVFYGCIIGCGCCDVGVWGNLFVNVDEKWVQLEVGYQWLM